MPVTDVGERNLLGFILDASVMTFKARLAKNDFPVDVDEFPLASIVEADFPGYTPVVDPTFTVIETNTFGYAEALSDVLEWVAGAIVDAQHVTALYITQSTPGGTDKLFYLYVFPLPINFNTEGQTLQKRVKVMVTDLAV